MHKVGRYFSGKHTQANMLMYLGKLN